MEPRVIGKPKAMCATCGNDTCCCRNCQGDVRKHGCGPNDCGYNAESTTCRAYKPKGEATND